MVITLLIMRSSPTLHRFYYCWGLKPADQAICPPSTQEKAFIKKIEKVTEMIAGALEILYEYDELLMSKFPVLQMAVTFLLSVMRLKIRT